jgi:hypothetical protein
MTKRGAIINLSYELLVDALAMPEGTVVYNVSMHPKRNGCIRLVVLHEDLPVVNYGEELPEISPTIEADYKKKPSTWLTFNWGV